MITHADHVDVELTDAHLDIARDLAVTRNESSIKAKAKSNKRSKYMSDEETNYLGMLAEVAYCVRTGRPFSDIQNHPNGDLGWDFRIPGLGTLDVKIETVRGYNLYLRSLKKRATAYLLMWPKSKHLVTMVGAMSRKRFEQEMTHPSYMPDVWLVPWESLLSIEAFEALVEERRPHNAD